MPGGTQQSFIRGDFAPRSTPLPFYIPFWGENAVLSHTFFWQKDPFHIPSLELCIPLNCCTRTVFFTAVNASVRTLGFFLRMKWQIFLTFYILQLVKSLPFHILEAQERMLIFSCEALKKYPFWVKPLSIDHYRDPPPPPGMWSYRNNFSCIK